MAKERAPKNSPKHRLKNSLVMKFGGTSVGGVERMRASAKIIKHFYEEGMKQGYGLCVVVSAMAGETNRLVALVQSVNPDNKHFHVTAEYDAVVATGENVSAGLMALVLNDMGIPARSWQGFQTPIKTNEQYGAARIMDIEVANIKKSILKGEVAVVTGFQGVDDIGRVTTFGRGGSDTSAVAMAVALKSVRCDIYTDVDGVYSSDPRTTKEAKKLQGVAYEEMLEMASSGSKVLHARSVELAMKFKMPLQVLSSFVEPGDKTNGTMVLDEKELNRKNMNRKIEEKIITAVAVDDKEAKVTIYKIKNKPGRAALIFGRLADANINVDMIIQSGSHHEKEDDFSDITFTLPRQDLKRGLDVLQKNKTDIGYEDILFDDKVAKISIIGVGMRSSPGVAKTMFETLAREKINIDSIATSEIKISVLVQERDAKNAVQELHSAFHLG